MGPIFSLKTNTETTPSEKHEFHHVYINKGAYLPSRGHIRIGSVQISRRLRPPGSNATAVVAASTGTGGSGVHQSGTGSLAVKRPAPELQLLPVHLLLLVAEQLVDEHAGEYAGQDAGDRDPEEGAKAGVESTVDCLAVGRSLEQDTGIRVSGLRGTVTRAGSVND